MKSTCLILFVLIASFTACSKKTETPPTPEPPVKAQAVSVDALSTSQKPDTAQAPPPPAPVPADNAPAPANAANELDQNKHWNVLGPLNDAILVFVNKHNRTPKNLEELVAEKIIKQLPQPPPNLRFRYDQANGVVTLTR